jgi:hypothetical protein
MSCLHSLIDCNYSQPEYRRLLHHRDRNNPKILYYSVQLNDRGTWEQNGYAQESIQIT